VSREKKREAILEIGPQSHELPVFRVSQPIKTYPGGDRPPANRAVRHFGGDLVGFREKGFSGRRFGDLRAQQRRAWFEELATGRARSLQELAERDGITRRYVRRLVDLAFLSPELVEAILQGRQPVELTATRLIELDLPLDWTDQRSLFAR
jgi:hypothetical protein